MYKSRSNSELQELQSAGQQHKTKGQEINRKQPKQQQEVEE